MHADKSSILEKAAMVVEAACTKSEDNKELFMSGRVGQMFCEIVTSHGAILNVVSAVSKAIVRLTTADDSRPVVSR